MDRLAIKEFINKIVREEHGMPMRTEEDKLVDTGCDSFGITMVLLNLDQKYNAFNDEWIKNNPVEEWTLGSIIDRVISNVH